MKHWASSPIVIFLTLIITLAVADIRTVFDPPYLLPILNTTFLSVTPLLIASAAARAFLSMGSPTLFLLSCGMVALAIGGLIAGWFLRTSDGPNMVITIYNSGVLFCALFHAIGAITAVTAPEWSSWKRRKPILMIAYSCIALILAVLYYAAIMGHTPPFIVQGIGPTLTGRVVLGAAILLLGASSVIFAMNYADKRVDFIRWYATGLGLVTIGLTGVFLQKAMGSPIGWAGRFAQYTGVMYILFGLLSFYRKVRRNDITFEESLSLVFREAEANYKTLIDTARDTVISTNQEGRIILWSRAAEYMFGYGRKEAIGVPLREMIFPDTYKELQPQACFPSGDTASSKETWFSDLLEAEVRTKAGKVFPAEISLSSRRDSSRVMNTYIIRDITKRKQAEETLRQAYTEVEMRVGERTAELSAANASLKAEIIQRKQTEEELRESNELFALFIRHSPIYTYIKEVTPNQSIVLRASDNFGQMIGIPGCEMVGKTMTELFPSEFGVKITADDWAVVSKGDVLQLAEELNGRSYSTIKFPIIRRDRILLAGYTIDITESKRAEEELRLFKSVFDHSNEACAISDSSGSLVYINKAHEKLFGRSLEEARKLNYRDYYPPESIEILNQQVVPSLDRGESWEGELQVFDAAGRSFPLWERADSIRDAGGKLLFGFGFMHDITERKQAEEQVRQLQKTESLGRMAGAIAHHFNNQLGVVIGNLEMTIDDLPQGAAPVTCLTAAMQAAGKAAEMSSLMLTYLGQTHDKHEPLDLSDACRKSLRILGVIIPGKVLLETDFPTPGPVISANADQIQQALINMLANAWESVREGECSIRLRVKTVSPADIHALHLFPIAWQPRGNAYACLEVADTGGGIADKDIEKIFDPFFTSKFTGRGMGLPVVLGIVKGHNGAVTVESEPGRGSTFRVFFPVSAEHYGDTLRQGVPITPSPIMPAEGGGTVLLVDDEEMVRDMAAIMLKRLGYSVLEAKDGAEALEVFRQRRDEIRLVLCDLTMPHMDGWETLTALRKLAPDIPVILASGYSEAQVMAGYHPELPQVFLGKPYKLKDLGDAISQALVSMKK